MASSQNTADDFALSRVPAGARLPMWEVMLVRVGALTSLAQFMMGAAIGYGMTFWQAFWATMLGSVVLEIVSFLVGVSGAREGLSTSLLARWTGFGKYGSGILGLVIAVGSIGWFGIQNSVFAKGLDQALGGLLGFPLAASLTGMFVTLIVIFGFKWLSWTARIAVPGFMLVIVYGIYQVLKNHNTWNLIASAPPGPTLSMGVAATMVAGGYMIGAVITPDMSRYCRNGKDVLWMTLIGTLVGEFGVNLAAVLMAHAVGTSDVVTIVMKTTGWLGTAIVVFATVKINDLNLYASSLGITNAIDSMLSRKVNRGFVTLIIGIIGTVLSVFGILDKFINFMVFLGVFVPPVAGIMVVDYFILKRDRKLLADSREKSLLPETCETINPVTLIAWALGGLAGYLINIGIPSLNSLIISGVAYYIGMKIFGAIMNQKNAEIDQTA
ncbi:cytosine permease [Aneurinibacillus sp. Ricciae_BoGa-3]|uniref:purine-cytosine permease family protein n=1 Tax=Aneurinibacillus sp. Ricciae_BoGa-3 TaxID=3022697 RepID=UPI00234064E4|nr:cytosine permease [Aneurinibacillus sp. Ricciae_BoGa-3]WCK52617.1 cytosine permease [Aneurinibacillus sp. Ricciae_BoGa-3]